MPSHHRISLLALGALLLAGLLPSQRAAGQSAVVRGRVTDAGGSGVPFAGVQIDGATAGAATDTTGRFRFATRATGAQTLRTTALGFAPVEQSVQIAPGDTLSVEIVLHAKAVELEEAVVTARSRPTALGDAAEMRPLEAVTTAGASGDPFRALKLLPGASAAGDGSALLVRGGDKSETRVLLDGAPVTHPYRQETPTGGAFGTLPPFLVQGMHFSAGGFSARYGGALSGVLAMESEGLPQETSGTASLGLAAISLRAGVPLSDQIGVRVSGNRSFTGALFRVNGQADAFPAPPRAVDGSANLTYRYDEKGGGSGQVKLFGFAQRNRLGVEEHAPAFTGVFRNQSTNQLYFADWTHFAGPWMLEANLLTDRHTAEQSFGALQLRENDHAARLRVDVAREWNERFTLTAGAEAARRTSSFRGRVPTAPGLQPPGAATTALEDRASAWQGGAYAEAHAHLTGRLSLRAGLRTDRHTRARRATFAPRLQLRYRLAEGTYARLAYGRYHQFPDPQQFGRATGQLGAERARHFIAGLRHERGEWQARLEAYAKPYDHLVVQTPGGGYANAGDGHAYGLDAFAKYGAFLRTRVSGWAAYSFLRSGRTQLRQIGGQRVLEEGPTPQSATHSFTLVGKMQVAGGLYAGGTFRWATGRPVTPVVASVPTDGGNRFLPVEGPVGSERRPAFRRFDLQLSYYRPFGDGRAATFYVSLANALAHENVSGYDYNADYSERTPVFSPYQRLFYAGVTVDF